MSGSTFAWRGKNILKLADVNSNLSRDISLTLMRSPGLLNTPLVHPGNKDNCVYLPVLWWHQCTSLDLHLALEHMAFFVFKGTHFRVRSLWLLRFDVGSSPGQSELTPQDPGNRLKIMHVAEPGTRRILLSLFYGAYLKNNLWLLELKGQ